MVIDTQSPRQWRGLFYSAIDQALTIAYMALIYNMSQ